MYHISLQLIAQLEAPLSGFLAFSEKISELKMIERLCGAYSELDTKEPVE